MTYPARRVRRPFPWHIVVFLAPAVLIYTVVMIYPILSSLWLSLRGQVVGSPEQFVGLANYQKLLGTELKQALTALQRTAGLRPGGQGQQADRQHPGAATRALAEQGKQAAEQGNQGKGAQTGSGIGAPFSFHADEQADAERGGKCLQGNCQFRNDETHRMPRLHEVFSKIKPCHAITQSFPLPGPAPASVPTNRSNTSTSWVAR